MRRTLWAVLTAGTLLLPVGAWSKAGADEPPKKSTDRDTAETPKPKPTEADTRGGGGAPARASGKDLPVVITNEWLESRYGGAEGPVSAVSGIATPAGTAAGGDTGAGESVEDPLAEIADEQARERTRNLLIARLDGSIAEAEAKIADLERRILAIRNPFLPRPAVPPDQAAEWDALTPTQRIERTQAEIDDLRRRLEADRGQRYRLAASR